VIKAQLNGDRIDLFWVVDNQILQMDCIWLKDIDGFELQRAAPEMLEALENALPILRTIWQEPYEGDDWEERDEAIQDVIFGIDAAIAKAKGES